MQRMFATEADGQGVSQEAASEYDYLEKGVNALLDNHRGNEGDFTGKFPDVAFGRRVSLRAGNSGGIRACWRGFDSGGKLLCSTSGEKGERKGSSDAGGNKRRGHCRMAYSYGRKNCSSGCL